MRNKLVTGFRDGLIRDKLCKEKPEVELIVLVELTMKRESSVKTSFSSGTEVRWMGKVINGDKRAKGEKNKVFSKQWSFKEGTSKRSTGNGKTSNSTKNVSRGGYLIMYLYINLSL